MKHKNDLIHEKNLPAAWLLLAGLTYVVLLIVGKGFSLYLFFLPLFFAAVFILPAWVPKNSSIAEFSLECLLSQVLLIPFVIAISVQYPWPPGKSIALLGVLAFEFWIWPTLYRRKKSLYNLLAGLIVLFPLLVSVLFRNVVFIKIISPFCFVRQFPASTCGPFLWLFWSLHAALFGLALVLEIVVGSQSSTERDRKPDDN